MGTKIRTREQQDRYTCSLDGCEVEFTERNAVDGSYCSSECVTRADGRGLLRDLRQDHTVCGTCFRLTKTIEKPPDEYRRRFSLLMDDAVVGFEHLTEHAERGPYGLECVCGSVNGAESDTLRRGQAWHWWLATASEHLREIGRRDTVVDVATVADELWNDADLELAIGRALE